MDNKFTDWECPLDKMKGGNSIQLTEGLFYETLQMKNKADEAVYTLQDRDRGNTPSAYLIYMSSVDEYEAALKLVGSMRHWRKLSNLKWFKEGRTDYGFDGLNQWRLDMEARDQSSAKKQLIVAAEEGNVAAMKSIHSMKPKQDTNKQVRQQARTKAASSQVVDLMKRMERT